MRLGDSPKSLNYKEDLVSPWQHWASTIGPAVYVVEDIPSSERLAQEDKAAVSLIGVHASDDCLDEIVAVARGRPVILALDRDAASKSFDIQERLSLRTRSFVALLPKDVKDMAQEELKAWLNGGY